MASLIGSAIGTSGAHGGGYVGPFNAQNAGLIVVSASTYGPGSSPTITDTKGNTYVKLTVFTLGNARHTMFYCLNPIGGPGQFVVLNPTSTYSAVAVYAFAGATFVYDALNQGITGTTSPITVPSVTPSAAGAVIVTGFVCDETTLAGYPAGFTGGLHLPNAGGLNVQGAAAYLIQGAAAAVSPAWAFTNTHQAAASLAVFKEAAITGDARVSQLPIEIAILSDAPNPAKVSQTAVEVLVASDPPIARLSQVAVEVMLEPFSTLPAKLSQVAVEVMVLPGPAGGVDLGPFMGDGGGSSIWIE